MKNILFKKMKKIFSAVTLSVLLLSSNVAYAQTESPDTVAQELDEVVVEAKREHTTATITTYIPVSQVKESSQDAVDMLQRMAIPQITINPITKAVTTPSGDEVTLFINYLAASSEDIVGLRTADVKRVEYLDYPSDPRFRGKEHVVNIIVQKYVYGGYTKLTDAQFFMGGYSNQGSVYSKFAYRKMTYDLYVGSDYVNTKHVGSSESSIFRLPEKTVERNMDMLSSDFSYLSLPVTFRASYNTDKTQIVNSIGYKFFDKGKYNKSGMLTITPDDAGLNYTYESESPEITRTLTWDGQYYFALPSKWSVNIVPTFYYGHNNSYSKYDATDGTNITNDAKEDVYYTRFDADIARDINDHNTLKLNLLGGSIINHVTYMGTSPYYTKFSNSYMSASAVYTFKSDKLNVNADGGVIKEFLRTNGLKYDDIYPFAHVSLAFSLNPKNRVNMWFQYATNSPGSDERSPNVIQSNEFLYQTGNPYLSNSRHITLSLNYLFLPNNKFTVSAYAKYFGLYNRAVNIYSVNPDNESSLIKGYENNGDYNYAEVGANFIARLLNSNLIMQVVPAFKHFNSSGYFDKSYNQFKLTAYCAYYLGNFNFSGYYSTREHAMDFTTGVFSSYHSYYQLQVGWSKRNWNLSLAAMNFGRYKYDATKNEVKTPLYSNTSIVYNGNYHANIMLSATYTFSYGKKVQQGDEIGAKSGGSSAIMK
jgi:hypothetical protein